MEARPKYLVVGLGNPGTEYRGTRHNVGFEVCDQLAKERGLLFERGRALDGYSGPKKFRFAFDDRSSALFVKPETYMNRSGDVVAPLARWAFGPASSEDEELDVSRLFVVYDDLDLAPASLRIRPHGGAGGQNGMRSIISSVGSDRFPRLRVGIGRSGTDAARHVLGVFDPNERVEIDISVQEAAEAILHWLETDDLSECMSRFHSRWNPGPETGA